MLWKIFSVHPDVFSYISWFIDHEIMYVMKAKSCKRAFILQSHEFNLIIHPSTLPVMDTEVVITVNIVLQIRESTTNPNINTKVDNHAMLRAKASASKV